MTDGRKLVAELAATRDAPTFTGRCIYCGCRCYGRACAAHRDLTLTEQQQQRGA